MAKYTSVVTSIFLVACGEIDNPPGIAVPVSLHIAPGAAELDVIDGALAQQGFTATLAMSDGATIDVTDGALFSVNKVRLGQFSGGLFSASGLAAGTGVVTALHEGVSGQATITVRVHQAVVAEGAPADAPGRFDAATEDAALAPEIVYPQNMTLVPPNLGEFDVHWQDSAGNDVFEVTLASEYVDLRMYVSGTPNNGSWVTVAPELWSVAGASHRGGELTVTVRGLRSDAPGVAGTSAALTTLVATQELQGGIYYWASRSTTGAGGIYRHDMGRVGAAAEPFYTTAESPGHRCVACHVMSRDGTRMAITYIGGNGAATIVDVATRTPILAVDGTYAWNFASFEPNGSRIVTAHRGALTLRNAEDGMNLGTVPTGGWATHPDFHPYDKAITYVLTPAAANDWTFTGGNIMIQPFEPGTGTFGEAISLVEGNGNNYYPSWSPDGEWILFNKSTENAYDNGTAELYVVKADGSIPPIRLDSPNVGSGLTNSWARWAPFEQILGNGRNAEVFYWFTFSSKRDFGVRLRGVTRPQIWMAPFFPERALAGGDPSGPAFRLPQQDITGNNHIAQWTEQVVPVE